jgi:hypothetical protein
MECRSEDFFDRISGEKKRKEEEEEEEAEEKEVGGM